MSIIDKISLNDISRFIYKQFEYQRRFQLKQLSNCERAFQSNSSGTPCTQSGDHPKTLVDEIRSEFSARSEGELRIVIISITCLFRLQACSDCRRQWSRGFACYASC